MGQSAELERIKAEYARRRDDLQLARVYTYFNPSNLYRIQSRERLVLKLLDRYGFNPLSEKRILDVGCGSGGELRNLIQYGADPSKLCGIDLMPDRIAEARRLSPNVGFICGSAETLPYDDASFDLVLQFTVFTSILDGEMKRRIAREMLRVLRPDGGILWYDFHFSNPANLAVRGVTRAEIEALFPGCRLDMRRVTLAPPIADRLSKVSVLACHALEKVPWLCTHYLGMIFKP